MLAHKQADIADYSLLIVASYERFLKKTLVAADVSELAIRLYNAPFVLVSHGIQPDPVFCYANLAAQRLWNMDWQTFVTLPSRLSAEPDAQEERNRLLALAKKQGYIDNYHGIRVTAEGKRFRIKDCVLWNVVDRSGKRLGQAACFSQVEWL